MPDGLAELADLQDCWCVACHAMLGGPRDFYNLCPDCGNKRCPKATNHLHHCSGSNDSGQVGSTYGAPCLNTCCETYNAYCEKARADFRALLDGGLSDD